MASRITDEVYGLLDDEPTEYRDLYHALRDQAGAGQIRRALLDLNEAGKAELVAGKGWRRRHPITLAQAEHIADRIIEINFPSEMGYDGLVGALDEGALSAGGIRSMMASAAIAGSEESHGN